METMYSGGVAPDFTFDNGFSGSNGSNASGAPQFGDAYAAPGSGATERDKGGGFLSGLFGGGGKKGGGNQQSQQSSAPASSGGRSRPVDPIAQYMPYVVGAVGVAIVLKLLK